MSSLLKKVGLMFDPNKVKPYLKMSIQRLQLLINKKTNHVKINKKEISRLLADGKEEKARIRVEQVIREDNTVQAYDILELHCELAAERIRFLSTQKECPQDMEQAVCTLIWAADRAEVPELSTVRDQFAKKYGAEFVRKAEINDGGCVNHKVVEKLSVEPPSGAIITEYLVSIAEEYGVEYEPTMRKSTAEFAEPAESVAAAQPAYEASPHASFHASPATSAAIPPHPPVGQWGAPHHIPHAHATAEPMRGPSHPGVAGGEIPVAGMPAAYPIGPAGPGAGFAVDPAPSDVPPGGKRASVGWDEVAKSLGPTPSSYGGGGKGEPPQPTDGSGGSAGKWGVVAKVDPADDPPPPYTPYDIPSPPRTRPAAPAVTLDIPAAPGYEDSPPRKHGTQDIAPSAPPEAEKKDDPPASPGGGDGFYDLTARLQKLRNL